MTAIIIILTILLIGSFVGLSRIVFVTLKERDEARTHAEKWKSAYEKRPVKTFVFSEASLHRRFAVFTKRRFGLGHDFTTSVLNQEYMKCP